MKALPLSFRTVLATLMLIFFVSAQAQTPTTPPCYENFSISTQITPSRCQSDGQIAITLTGEYDNYYNFSYALQSTAADGYSSGATSNTTLTGIPAGTYTLIVSAVCKEDENARVTKTFSNIVVPGTYKTIKLAFDQKLSLSSMPGCATGRIVLNAKDGNGNYRFRIVQAPAGVTVPQEVIPVKKGDTYTFPTDTYPTGFYRIEAYDDCYTASIDLTLPQLQELPKLQYEYYSIFRAYPTNTYDCSILRPYIQGHIDINTNFELLKAVKEGLFEVGLAPKGEVAKTWHTLSMNNVQVSYDMSPMKASDFYEAGSLEMSIRAKNCPTFIRTFPINVKPPYITYDSTPTPDCSNLNYTIRPWTDYDGIYCFPLDVTIRKKDENGEIYQTAVINNHNDRLNCPLPYNSGTYHITVADKERRFVYTNTYTPLYALNFQYFRPLCQGYTESLYPGSFQNCLPVTIEVVEKDSSPENIVATLRYTTASYQTTPPLEYDKTYIYRVRRDGEANILYVLERSQKEPKTSYDLLYPGDYYVDKCREDWGQLLIRRSVRPRPNTTYQITGPQGFIPQTITNPSDAEQRTSNAFTPPGLYTLTATDECGTSTVTYNHPGFYHKNNFTYTSQQTCEGLVVSPSATLTYGGVDQPVYFRIVSGPEGGFSSQAISLGESLTLGIEGVYQLGLCRAKAYDACPLATITIDYKRPSLQLSKTHTSAYVCSAEDLNGHIIVKAENGVEPYTYELYDEHNQTKIDIPHTVEPSGAWHYVHGKSDDVFTIRMKDACGNRFAQQVTMLNMKLAIVAATRNSVVCAGEKIELLSLPFDSYEWYYPDGTLLSTEQNPVIFNAKPSHSGLYKVKAFSAQCNSRLEGFIRVTVLPCYAPVNPQLMNRSTQWK